MEMGSIAAAKQAKLDLSEVVLNIMDDAHRDVSFSELLTQLVKNGFGDQAEIKATIWQLIAEERIDLTSDRNLMMREEVRKQIAEATQVNTLAAAAS